MHLGIAPGGNQRWDVSRDPRPEAKARQRNGRIREMKWHDHIQVSSKASSWAVGEIAVMRWVRSGTEGFLEEVDGFFVAFLGDEEVGPFAKGFGEAGAGTRGAEQVDGLAVGGLGIGWVAGLAF